MLSQRGKKNTHEEKGRVYIWRLKLRWHWRRSKARRPWPRLPENLRSIPTRFTNEKIRCWACYM